MSDLMEITELDLNDGGFGNDIRSSNFGGGLELLMNDKVRESSRPTSDIDLEDLNKLENELKKAEEGIVEEKNGNNVNKFELNNVFLD